jgi:hypothetical protein
MEFLGIAELMQAQSVTAGNIVQLWVGPDLFVDAHKIPFLVAGPDACEKDRKINC